LTGWLLAIDTATDALSVALGQGGKICFSGWQRRRKGHAEELAPLIDRAMKSSGVKPSDLSSIAVTIGPGTFTGVRIGLAAARGMRVALRIPIMGVNTLELLAVHAAERWPDRPVMTALDARRGQVYAQYFRRADGEWPEPWSGPAAMPATTAATILTDDSVLIGNGATLIANEAHSLTGLKVADCAPDAAAIIRFLADRPIPVGPAPPPAPVYLRAPDAIPAKPLLNL
jgi:tRNA threonylcarbamoyladenosine biosynthesis protein TsaB